ncbi:MAG: ATP-binding protein [Spirochaetes bacterium]|nr:ATP-binding protein [Spirochaetota bacterium]
MEIRRLLVDENTPFFNTEGMKYKEFNSKFNQIRNYATIIAFEAPASFRMKNLLEQQISEIIKNAVVHGNKQDPEKLVKVWWSYNEQKKMAKLIVEDEGVGFEELGKWNKFHEKRSKCFYDNNFEEMLNYISYRSETSGPDDGGNALFAAVEFWNGGMIYNSKKNKVVCLKYYTDSDFIDN